MMEQRFCNRLPLVLDVTLSTAKRTLSCTTRNFGMGGMFIEAEDNLPSQGEHATINFTLKDDNLKNQHSIKVIIVRTEQDGIGISFAQPNATTYRTVQELLKCGKQQSQVTH